MLYKYKVEDISYDWFNFSLPSSHYSKLDHINDKLKVKNIIKCMLEEWKIITVTQNCFISE